MFAAFVRKAALHNAQNKVAPNLIKQFSSKEASCVHLTMISVQLHLTTYFPLGTTSKCILTTIGSDLAFWMCKALPSTKYDSMLGTELGDRTS